jgi:hypothetical protein
MTIEPNARGGAGLRSRGNFLLIIVVALAGSRISCFGQWPPILHLECPPLTNLAQFHEVRSTTNVPADVLKWIRGRLVWAATDNTNWVVHYEILPENPNLSHVYIPPKTNYGIAAKMLFIGPRKLPNTDIVLPGGRIEAPIYRTMGSGSFRSYKDFIDYELELVRRLP